MAANETYVIVGASLAGAKAAQTLREEGFDGRVVLVGEEPERPYERPPLSKGHLLGKEPAEKAYVHEEGWYAEHEVELWTGQAASGIDRVAHEVLVGGREPLPYTKLLLTTGSSPRRLAVPGADLPGVHYLRRMGDSAALRAALQDGGKRVVVIGAGWIGLETAAAARTHGNEVTVVEPAETPLSASLGPELGQVFADLHIRKGVEIRTGEGAAEVRESSVVTTSGAELAADLVIVGVGVVPNTGLAESAGLDVDNGILVDQSLRTSDPDIFAAGDVANAFHPLLGRRLRVEHWANALNGGPAAARSMLGQDVSYERVPYFYTDQYDLGMELSGFIAPGEYDQVVYRGDVGSLEFIAFWLADGRVRAGMNVNVWDVTSDVQALILSGKAVDLERLADPKVSLAELA